MAHPDALNDTPQTVRPGVPQARNPTTPGDVPGLVPSMGSIGDCYDNAMIESFWGRMQTELLNRKRWKTRIELANAIWSIWRSSTTANAVIQPSGCAHR